MELLKLEKHGQVAVLTFNRPDALNALGMRGDGETVRQVCDAVNRDGDLRCVILTGAGRAFCSGGDLKAMAGKTGAFSGGGTEIWGNYRREFQLLSRAIYGIEIPVIAAVNGAAAGLGCDIACLADVRIASEDARFGVTFLKAGLIPGDGGAWLLQRCIGFSHAAELLYTGKLVDARTAEQWGLVSRVVPPESLLEAAFELAGSIAKQSPHTLRLTKNLLRQGRESSYEAVMEMSATAQALCHLTQDHKEGVAAIIDRREPQFIGK